MTNAQSTPRKPLRLWPGVALVTLQWLLRFVVPVVIPSALVIGLFGSLIGGVLVALWWLFFSRAPWLDRIGGILLMAGALWATRPILDISIATAAMNMLYPVLAIPTVCLALVASAALTRSMPGGARRAWMAVAIVAGCAGCALIRTGGFSGSFKNDLHWRWTKSPEEKLMAQSAMPAPPAPAPAVTTPPPAASTSTPAAPAAAPESSDRRVAAKALGTPAVMGSAAAVAATPAEWPGFRGPHRDGVVAESHIDTDWTAHPPVKMWKRPVGPGWSSFAVHGDRFFTQEQRGPEEVVACYQLSTGEPIWMHRDPARFWEANAGAGPRGTPTLGNGRVYALGATGVLNVLNETDGSVIWSHNVASETGKKTPEWGFSGSPLLYKDLVIVAASGEMAAYDSNTGASRWFGPKGKTSYSSPHLLTANGVDQILLVDGEGIVSVAPADGKVLWEHAWPGYPILQPAVMENGDVLFSVTESSGTRRLSASNASGAWKVEEKWTTMGMKPYFNDLSLHNGHAYGFDGSILACIDLADGKRKWKGGRYGHGQLVLLASQDLLLVLGEEGELALVKATTDQFTEVARVPGIEGKTWNHPVLAGNVLLVRNSEEMAAFRLAR